MAISDWSATDLCSDGDILRFESDFNDWVASRGSGQFWRDTAKELIADKLRASLIDTEMVTDETDVLDLISNPEVLKNVACYKTLQVVANDNVVNPGDRWTQKAIYYSDLFDDGFDDAVAMLHIDLDESGTIEDSEKYRGSVDIKFERGG
jgi:hypothetical protein